MKLRYFLSFLLLGLFVTATAQSKSKAKAKTKKKVVAKANFTLLEASTWRTLPGMPGAEPQTEYRFVIVWQNASYPETFFWRGDAGWLTCQIDKAHKAKGARDYTTEFVTGDQMHKGDTLLLKPVRGGRFPIPAEIPEKAKNTLFYKVGGSGWLAFPVSKITRKADVALP
jgi:hypothetical protein